MSDDRVIAVSLFAGAGGIDEGLAQACDDSDRPIDLVAVNHWNRAIETHALNHPDADRYNAKVEELQPREAVPEGDVKLVTGGFECTHFSGARGGKPVDDQKRASPWHVLDWVTKTNPENLLIENVPEFESWGPVIDGKPTRNGKFFEAWVTTLRGLGYSVAWRVLNAADYGDATRRKRLFIIARRGVLPEWPEPTHSEGGEKPGTEPWRTAAEIIDWSDRGQSIWTRGMEGNGKKPLATTTMQRIAEGIRRFGADELEPFADAMDGLGNKLDPGKGRDVRLVEEMQENAVPLGDVGDVVEERCEPFLVKFYGTSTARPTDEPIDTITAGGGKFALATPCVLGQQSGAVARPVDEKPVPTVATGGAISMFEPSPFVLPRLGRQRGDDSNPPYDPEEEPLHTVTAQNHDGHAVTPYLVPFYGERDGQNSRTGDVDDPLPSVPASKSPAGVAQPFICDYEGPPDDPEEPLGTITSRERFALCVPDLYPWGLDVRFRMLQPRELAAAMGFPSDYEFAGNKGETTEQIGNAVPVNMAKALCERLLATDSPTLDSFTTTEPADSTAAGGEVADD